MQISMSDCDLTSLNIGISCVQSLTVLQYICTRIYYTAVSCTCHTHAVAGKVLTMPHGEQDGEGDLFIDV